MTKKIKDFLQQAEVYRKQGLLNEAKKKYEQVNEIIEASDTIPNRQKLLDGLAKKLALLSEEVSAVENAPPTPEMSSHVNDLIKKLFSFSNQEKDENDSALEGAIALAKFGQFEGALEEFHKLLDVESQRVAAAKNILRCYLEIGSTGEAAKIITEWQNSDGFSPDQLEIILSFYDNILEKKGLKPDELAKEPALEAAAAPEETTEAAPEKMTEAAPIETGPADTDAEESDDEFLDISAVAITFDSGPYKGEQVELDVSFQSGNIISLIISSKDEGLIESLKVGYRLDDVHFYSPVAIFRGSGVVSAQTKIKSGPKMGDYSLDITIESL